METEGRFYRAGFIARETLLFRVELPAKAWAGFTPGQHAYLKWIAPQLTDEKGNGRNFSIVSPPGDLPSLMFATRLTGSAFKKNLESLPAGTPIGVDGPFGTFCLPEGVASTRSSAWEKPVVLVAGGIGITPFMSMLRDSLSRLKAISFYLFTANRTIEDSAFQREVEELSRHHKNLFLGQFVSHATTPLAHGIEVGRLTPDHLFEAIGEKARNGEFYIAGPPTMVSSFKVALLGAGVLSERIHVDPFLGYF